ncbi:hypothetical protein KY487_23740 [Ralstonia pseudosolanacearum]|uniref:hypothetical protein n=1 Tax=Ralstonia pseudosolanacearum TaxID=1310165 RepID=UPI001C8C84C9|nr:hypothetical protein [Ralstonia pseudosolanacearum]MBX9432253.1 hypothetical protein [Ralstonia pseudosolanacearum]
MSSIKQKNLLRTAFEAYLHRFDEGKLVPSEDYLPYEFDAIDLRQWRLLAGTMVKDELQEITNKLNHWHGSLYRWCAWNDTIRPYSEDDAWELRMEFLEPLAHSSLLMPSSTRDTFTFIATNSMHQVRLATEPDYRDFLEGDPQRPGEKVHLSRRKKELRLQKLIAQWPKESAEFMAALRLLDGKDYREATSDYRNLNSHSIGPRLGIGITRTVVRYVEQATTLVKQADGTHLVTLVPGKMQVHYGVGGTTPLDMEAVWAANLDQYRRARECYSKYRSLLNAGLAAMPQVQAAS